MMDCGRKVADGADRGRLASRIVELRRVLGMSCRLESDTNRKEPLCDARMVRINDFLA